MTIWQGRFAMNNEYWLVMLVLLTFTVAVNIALVE